MLFTKKKNENQNHPSTPETTSVQEPVLKIKVQDGKACEKILTIEVGKEQIQEEYDAFYKAIAPKAKVPGFRPGKVPHDVLVMHYEKDARDSVLEHLLSDSLSAAFKQKELRPLTHPTVEDVQFAKEKLIYKTRIEIRPKIKISKVAGLSAKKGKSEIKPEDIEKALKDLQERHCQYKAIEDRGAAMGDFVIADYVCTVDGKEIEKRNDDWVEIKEDEYLKGFSAQLVGAKAGDVKDVQITFPQDIGNQQTAGKTALFKMTIKEIKEKKLPAIDDELAKQAGDHKDLAELKEKLGADIKKRQESEAEAAFERDLLDELVKYNKIDLPQGVVDRRTEYLLEQTKQRFLYSGGTEDLFEKEKEKFKKDLETEARKQVHLAFLLDEIADIEKFDIQESDLKARYESLSHRYQQPAEVIEKYYKEHEEALESLHDQIRNEKVVEFIKKNAKISR